MIMKKFGVVVSKPVEADVFAHRFAMYVYTLVVNICGLIATLARSQDSKRKLVQPSHIKASLEYVKTKCYPKELKAAKQKKELRAAATTATATKGGSYHFDSQYFGAPVSSNYSESSGAFTVMDHLDFENGLARPALSMSGGASDPNEVTIFTEFSIIMNNAAPDTELFPSKYIREIFNTFGVTIGNNALDIVKYLLKLHLKCFANDLKKGKSAVTLNKLEKVAHMMRHSIFM
jgi:hypothetical protein